MLRHRTAPTMHRGDTIIEVLFAITIFSMIAVAAMSLMNRGLATSQRSLEITSVRQQMDAQAESLRLLHSAYINSYSAGATYAPSSLAGKYAAILASGKNIAASRFDTTDPCPTTPPSGAFVVYPRGMYVPSTAISTAQSWARIVETANPTGIVFQRSEGLWVEAVNSVRSGTRYTDFHIRACWEAPGQEVPMKLGTIVRLYDPR